MEWLNFAIFSRFRFCGIDVLFGYLFDRNKQCPNDQTIWMVIDTTMLCATHTCKENRKNLILMHFNNPKFIYLPKNRDDRFICSGIDFHRKSKKFRHKRIMKTNNMCNIYFLSHIVLICWVWMQRRKKIRDTHRESECYWWDCWQYIDTSISIVI